ncbi:hypothetical protein BX661DRAFT_162534 [Kickxella alabastrina]|uniref:uncharacterized protein n=1 Tax=Kickxella alabastrina TaxID=61397 RepID=UPI0022209ADD|nr:uncharacterized protein BX661DRAFT_162534 [Kickxella alabastrina]KAI7829286.1 hypothetical protein BX661DRAFT_162534 [Kickxella alabastrina]
MTKPISKRTVVNFDLSPEDIALTVDEMIAESKAILDQVAAEPNPTFNNVIVPLATRENTQNADYSVISFLQNVSTKKEVRDASIKGEEKLNAFEIEMIMREDVYKAVRAVYNNPAELAVLGPEDRRLVGKIEQGYRYNGLALSVKKRKRLSQISKRLSDLGIEFNSNINKSTGRILFTREDLDGLVDDYFEGRKTEVVDGVEKYVVTTKSPDMSPVMQAAKNEQTRKILLTLNKQLCPENIVLMQETIALRTEAAQLLEFKTHAEFKLSKVGKTPKEVINFEHDMQTRLQLLAKTEFKKLEKLKQAENKAAGVPYEGLYLWDHRYYSTLLKKHEYSISEDEVKQYFPVKEVIHGILDIFQNMFSLRFTKVENPPVWHDDVDMYEVWEATSDEFVGHFYLDLYPRENKYNHAAVWPIRAGYDREDGTREYPVAAMVANFSKPTGATPALLTHGNVVTFLHELGHVFHEMCSVTKWAKFHGTNMERDFVEAPSQMLENWGWDPSVLRKFAVHYKTGEPIPEDLVKRLVAAKNKGSGLSNLVQVFYGLYDMAIHDTADGKVDAKAIYNKLREGITMFKNGDIDSWGMATFGHMMGGYDTGYYGYLWSQVFSADMFASRFFKEGIDNPKTGLDYRREILLPGGSRDASVSLEKFLSRKPNNTAFLESIGLKLDWV